MSLSDIIGSWLKTQPELKHFHIMYGLYKWISCDCIDHAWAELPSYLVDEDRVVVCTAWTRITILAADPNFFSRLHEHLKSICKESSGKI